MPTLEQLLSRGFFPKEYPPAFTSQSFARYFVKNGAAVLSAIPKKDFSTTSATHNLARPGGARRRLHIPNPFAYARLCALLVDNWNVVNAHCNASPLAVSSPTDDPMLLRAVRPKCEGQELAFERARVRANSRFILRTDITRFFGSIYTHSVPWALVGKAVAKTNRFGGFANELDKHLRELQDGQTLGIPVGPDASFIVAEIVATAVDHLLWRAGLRGFRFMDDYEFGFSSRSDAEAALPIIEEGLATFELALNGRKTSIDQLPVELDRPWIAEIQSLPLELLFSRPTIVRFFNRVFELKAAFPHDPVLAYAVSRVRTATHIDVDGPVGDLLCQCALAEPGAMEGVVTILQEKGSGSASALDDVIRAVLEHQTALSHGSEVAWALWAAIWFKRKVSTNLAKRLDGNPDPAIALLTLCARSRGLIKSNVAFPQWTAMLTAESLRGAGWLLTYEADVKNWLRPTRRGVVHTDPLFASAKRARVSFFNPDVKAPTRTLLRGGGLTMLGIYGEPLLGRQRRQASPRRK